MKNYIIKNINVIVCLCLLTAILALSIAVMKNEKKAVANSAPISGDNLEDTAIDIPQNNLSPALNYKTSMPKPPIADESFLFSQDICGIGNIYPLSLHQTPLGLYIIAATECVYGDIAGVRPGVGVACLDATGTIKSTYYLPSQTSSTYITSQITALGLVIITADNENKQYFINILSYDCTALTTAVISGGITAKIVPTKGSFLILAEYAEETIIYNYTNGKLNFYSIGTMSLIELFEYTDYYLMFGNTPTGYCIIKVGKANYAILKQTAISGATLIAVKPAMEDNKQIFIIIESADATYAKKVDSSLDFGAAYTKKLGNFATKAICHSQNELLIVASGNINGLITLGYDLAVSYADSNSSAINRIFQSTYYKGAYYYLACDENNMLCLIKVANGVCVYNYLQINSSVANFAINTNDTLMLLYLGNFYEYASVNIKGIAL